MLHFDPDKGCDLQTRALKYDLVLRSNESGQTE